MTEEMTNYDCKDNLGNEIVVVTFCIKDAWKKADKRFKKEYKSNVVSVKADYSKIFLS